jgi:serine/threonine protein phosphatase PrpC
MIENMIRDWLHTVAPDRAAQLILDKSAILVTDVGLRRSENQDRVAALRVQPLGRNIQPFICFAVSDGMGGMKNGAECATLTLAALFSSLVQSNDVDSRSRLIQAAYRANKTVHEYALGKGGATLSAVLVEKSGAAHYVNVGDSRIYTVTRNTLKVERVTVDDTLKEAFGGEGGELVQFIGIGTPLLPRSGKLPSDADGVLLTSDGAHFIEPSLLAQIIERAADPIRAAERLVALSRWLGGPDNASVSAFRLPDIAKYLVNSASSPATIWSGSIQLQIAFEPQEVSSNKQSAKPRSKVDIYNVDLKPKAERSSDRRKPKKKEKHQAPAQLEIKISPDDDSDASNS